MDSIVAVLCRSSFYINLLGLKVPLALLVRASRARHALAILVLTWIPFSIYCKAVLLNQVATAVYGLIIWHVLIAIWITIPMLVVGSVILSHVRQRDPVVAFVIGLTGVVCFHKFVIPVLQPTVLGSFSLQALFAFFEDGSIAGWIWCLFHVVKLQNHVRNTDKMDQCPIEVPKAADDRVLIVGNAPTVMDGQPLGAEVDGFSRVVRFNQYTVSKPEYTGSKVSYHFCNGRNLPSTSTTEAVLPIFNASLTHAAYLFMPHMEDARETVATLMNTKASVWFVDEDRLLALRRKIGCYVWQIPSSGMVAIDAFAEKYGNVTIHGFNFFSGDKIHYFEESPLQLLTSWLERFVTHNPPKEKEWVHGLLKEGKAVFLDQCTKEKKEEDATTESAMGKDKKKDEDGEARRRNPGLLRTLLKDGMPSQFSL